MVKIELDNQLSAENPVEDNKVRERYVWKDGVPRPDRPMDFYLQDVLDQLKQNKVVVVQAETGVGKTSRIPQAILDNDPNERIFMTQPLRHAVRMNSQHIAKETGTQLGGELVDYSLYNVRQAQKSSRLELLIDQSLVNRIIRDKQLPDGVIIIDEAHQRSVDIDLLLFLIRLYLPKSDNTRVLITSATIDTKKFQNYFKYKQNGSDTRELSDILVGEPILAFNETLARIVTKEYKLEGGEHHSQGATRATLDFVTDFYQGKMTRPGEKEGDNDIPVTEGTMLVFLPGKDDIHEAYTTVLNHLKGVGMLDSFELLQTYRLGEDMTRVDLPIVPGKLRVIFTTEILKSSVTPPQTVCVIDSLQVKRNIENKYGVSKLKKITESGAEADQAKGRTGRECTGWYIPISYENEYSIISNKNSLEYWPVPAILREGIITTVLKIANVGQDIRYTKLIDQPKAETINTAIMRLQSIHALDDLGKITAFGKELLKFSTSPENARSYFRAKELGVLPEMLLGSKIIDNEGIFYVPGKYDSDLLITKIEFRKNLEQSLLGYVKDRVQVGEYSTIEPPITNVDELVSRLKTELALAAQGMVIEGFDTCIQLFQKEYVDKQRTLTSGRSFLEYILTLKISNTHSDNDLLTQFYFFENFKNTYNEYHTSLEKEVVSALGRNPLYSQKDEAKKKYNNQFQVENASDFIRVFQQYQQGYKKWCLDKRIPYVEFSLELSDLTKTTFPCLVHDRQLERVLNQLILSNRAKVSRDFVAKFLGVESIADSPEYYSVSISAGSITPLNRQWEVEAYVSKLFTAVVAEEIKGKNRVARLRGIVKERNKKFAMRQLDNETVFTPSDLFASIQAYRDYKVEVHKMRGLHRRLTEKLEKNEDAWLQKRGLTIDKFIQLNEKEVRTQAENVLVTSFKQFSDSLVASLRQKYGYVFKQSVFVENRMRAWCNYNGIQYKKITQVERDIRDLLIDLKNTSLKFEGSIDLHRDFDLDSLGRSMLAGLVQNVGFDKRGVVSSSIVSSFASINGPYVYGGIGESEVQQSQQTDKLHFADLCVPIKFEWLLEENPHLCTEVIDESNHPNVNNQDDRFYGTYHKQYIKTTYGNKVKELEPNDRTAYLAGMLEKGTSNHPEGRKATQLRYEVAFFYSYLLRDYRKGNQVSGDFNKVYSQKVKKCETQSQFFQTSILFTEDELKAYLADDYERFRVEFPIVRPNFVQIGEENIPITYNGYNQHIELDISLDQFMKLEARYLPVVPNYKVYLTCRGENNFFKQKLITVEKFEEEKEEVYSKYRDLVWISFLNSEKGKPFFKYGDKTYIRNEKGDDREVFVIPYLQAFPPFPEVVEWSTEPKEVCGYAYVLESEPRISAKESSWYLAVFPTQAQADKIQADADKKKKEIDAIWAANRDLEKLKVQAIVLLVEVEALRDKIDTDEYEKYGLTFDEVARKTFTRTQQNYPHMIQTKIPEWLDSNDRFLVKDAYETLIYFKDRLTKALAFYDSYRGRSGQVSQVIRETFASKTQPEHVNHDDIQFIGHISSGYSDTQLAVRLNPDDNLYYLLMFDEKREQWFQYRGFKSSLLKSGFANISAVKRAIEFVFKDNYGENFVSVGIEAEPKEKEPRYSHEPDRALPPEQEPDYDSLANLAVTRQEVSDDLPDPDEKLVFYSFQETAEVPVLELFEKFRSGYGNVATMNTPEWRFSLARLLIVNDINGLALLLQHPWQSAKIEAEFSMVSKTLKKAFNYFSTIRRSSQEVTDEYSRAQTMLEQFPKILSFYRSVKDLVVAFTSKDLSEQLPFITKLREYVQSNASGSLPEDKDGRIALVESIFEELTA